MKAKIRPIPHDNLYAFIKVNNQQLNIDFDRLVAYLFKDEYRNFNVSEFEKLLKTELQTKLPGQPVNSTVLTNVCTYIDKLSLYLTKKNQDIEKLSNLEAHTKEFYKAHKSDYEKILERAESRNPNEFKHLEQKFKSRE